MGADPGGDRLLGRPADRDDQPHVPIDNGLVQDLVAVADNGRAPVLGQGAQVVGVLAKERIHKGAQEQIGAVQAEVAQQVLHAGPGAAGEGAMRQRLVLGAFLTNHHHLGRAVQAARKNIGP